MLALKALEQLQQIHAGGHEGRKLDDLGEIDLGIEQEAAGVEDADDGVGRVVVDREAAVLMFARGGDHVLDAEIVGDAGHLRARLHHFAHGAAVEADDFQNDLELGLGERALLDGELEQFLIIVLVQAAVGADGFGNGDAQNRGVQALGDLAQRAHHAHEQPQRRGDAQRPRVGRAHGQRLGHDFADDQDQSEQEHERGGQGPMPLVQGHPEAERDEGGVGEGVAEDERGEQVLGRAEELDHEAAIDGGLFLEAAGAPFAEGKERRLRHGKEEAQGGQQRHAQQGKYGWREHVGGWWQKGKGAGK